MESIQLQDIRTNGNNGATYLPNEQVAAANGDSIPDPKSLPTEREGLLYVQSTGCNGETVPSGHAAEARINLENIYNPQENSALCRIRRELNEELCPRFRLWMALIFIFVIIGAVIGITLAVCSLIHEDKDDNFDRSLFKVPRYFNGSFQLPNLQSNVSTEELLTLFSNESQALTDLQGKLADLYTSSPALGRYFSKAEIYPFRNGSSIADFQLTFLMPTEKQDQLRNLVLSREMVYNVLRQFLYDQESDESEAMYIDPASLKMFLGH
ncbi:TPA-induced transmembrane protein [Centropristis striata]|uniref:TPA-induced transmembrane protein n=1 Tax=Centropristis striata TaxID=184440 RepID=UPI0027DFB465|nr:TPA-induced transmembrane protein [Centropristis striata]